MKQQQGKPTATAPSPAGSAAASSAAAEDDLTKEFKAEMQKEIDRLLAEMKEEEEKQKQEDKKHKSKADWDIFFKKCEESARLS